MIDQEDSSVSVMRYFIPVIKINILERLFNHIQVVEPYSILRTSVTEFVLPLEPRNHVSRPVTFAAPSKLFTSCAVPRWSRDGQNPAAAAVPPAPTKLPKSKVYYIATNSTVPV